MFRDMRAVRGVGALICDFFGVSVVFVRPARLDAVDRRALAVVEEGVEPFERFPAVMKGCRIAFWGLIRRSGSHMRHLETKSTKSSSSQRRTWARFFVPGLLLRPFELTTGRGAPVESEPKIRKENPSLDGTRTKEESLARTPVDEVLVWETQNFHYAG